MFQKCRYDLGNAAPAPVNLQADVPHLQHLLANGEQAFFALNVALATSETRRGELRKQLEQIEDRVYDAEQRASFEEEGRVEAERSAGEERSGRMDAERLAAEERARRLATEEELTELRAAMRDRNSSSPPVALLIGGVVGFVVGFFLWKRNQ
ncbi:uncharacterized protein LOC129587622 isoform X2 [Paramacrobiotus metropolitanus]|uniref:uncharacterized protein LOC129587622 isoform X2 n=1 Tax=Paramacrobiotus metropolitanus TaxID=2943436 RepID=UPI0024464BB8|nr:uncharacterized protein LOC129587622 isoform X2 [Paramacrobiotus metropolitanus]XP_055337425.1 uncharacterized protein LOC129587622 isoform X2 [Paramacrobiotus metropolitanus]XP_055337426.1 uncharacterized protein LOC129587622 isoform X2 [Paramacrobiotus metropolitanus]